MADSDEQRQIYDINLWIIMDRSGTGLNSMFYYVKKIFFF